MSENAERPQTPTPDTKDWTWTIREPCPECGFDASQIERRDVGELTRDYATVLCEAARAADGATRPQPDVWSPLEYACHVRDVCALFLGRLNRMLTEDDPVFANWDQDETALAGDYASQDPATVAGELRQAATTVADAYDSVPADAWSRRGLRSNGSEFTIATIALYHLHDVVHHAWDVD